MKYHSNTTVRVKDFANYLGRHRNTAAKLYKTYLVMVGKKPHMVLTVADVARIDDSKPEIVFASMFC